MPLRAAAVIFKYMIDGSICSIRIGLPGSGKSLGMNEEDALPHLLAGEEVWSNYWINWKGDNLHYYTNDEFDELAPTLRNCVLLMDEIGQVLEPRAWEQESGNIRRFFQLHRHHHVDIYGTTQDISLVAKTALIVVDEWILCDKVDHGAFINWILKNIFRKELVSIEYKNVSFAQLKKLSNGWEFNENALEDMELDRYLKHYSREKLLHRELDDKKVELKYRYCKKCAGRQGEKIDYEDKVNYLVPSYCPKHKDELLEIRESGMYDTDYDIITKEKAVMFQAMIPSPEGYTMIKYKGALSDKQIETKKKLFTSFKN